MTEEEPVDFTGLRDAAITRAQQSSGEIWTDFNLHDPGVTLLEQSCFALTETAYQLAHPIRDLLTSVRPDRAAQAVILAMDDWLDFDGLGLFDPRRVLPSAPVTDADFAAALRNLSGVDRVIVRRAGKSGLYRLWYVPASESDRVAGERLIAAFQRNRPLNTDLASVAEARRICTVLTGEVRITETARPERVAAEIYFHISQYLRGGNIRSPTEAVTRADAFDAPELMDGPGGEMDERRDEASLLPFLATLPGVNGIHDLSYRFLNDDRPGGPEEYCYRHIVLPRSRDQVELKLSRSGVPLSLDPGHIRDEYFRIAADHIAKTSRRLDEQDWDVMAPGHRRNFAQVAIDETLPMTYRIHEAKPEGGRGSLASYRNAINGHLEELSGALADIPKVFHSRSNTRIFTPEEHRLRRNILDYLIALQGFEMPVIEHAGVNFYRSAREKRHFELSWRLRLLEALPELNRNRGQGPDGSNPGGFMTLLGILADIDVSGSISAESGLTIGEPGRAPAFNRHDIPPMANPADILPSLDESKELMEGAALFGASTWVNEGMISARDLRRSADPDNFIVFRGADDRFRVAFDNGDPEFLHECASLETREEAVRMVNGLRSGWRKLHEAGEKALLIEDIRLRCADDDFTPDSATLMISGWTARCSQAVYRDYVSGIVADIAPAHAVISVLWLDEASMCEAGALLTRLDSASAGSDVAMETRQDFRRFLAEAREIP